MIRHYLTTGLRCLWRERGYAAINIAGLAVGLAGCIVMALWVVGEFSFDRFNQNGERIYRVYLDETMGDGSTHRQTATPAPLGPVLAAENPRIENMARAGRLLSLPVKCDNEVFGGNKVRAVDPSFLSMFSFEVIRGDAARALDAPDGMVLTESMARKLFGDRDAMGRSLFIDNKREHQVTAVIKDVPSTSHLPFDCLVPFASLTQMGYDLTQWDHFGYVTYLLLQPEADQGEVTRAIAMEMEEHLDESSIVLGLQRLFDIRLHSDQIQGGGGQGNLQFVLALLAAALVVLVISCVNFVNLATARSVRRVREIGLRRTVGALRFQLVTQLMLESLVTVLVAMAVALMLTEVALPSMSELAGRPVGFEVFGTGELLLWLVAVVVVVSLMAGLYPALLVSSQRTATMCKRTNPTESRGVLRRVLVVVQSILSMFLVVMTLVVYRQLNYIHDESVAAFEGRETAMTLRLGSESRDRLTALKDDLLALPEVQNASASSWLPLSIATTYTGCEWEGKDFDGQVDLAAVEVDENFVATYGLKVADGRFFSRERLADQKDGIVINETAAKMMGADGLIGKAFRCDGDFQIIGVVKDFHFEPLQNQIGPLIMFGSLSNPRYLGVRLRTADIAAAVDKMQNVWEKLIPGEVFEFRFLDEEVENRYTEERVAGKLTMWFAVTAIIVACLGLFSLSAYTTQRRVREIGIRRTLGASESSVVRLLCGEYALLVLVAAAIAAPAAYFASEAWLNNFAYRVSLDPVVFVIALVVSATVTAVSVSWPAVRAARINPVESLRHE